MHDSSDEARGRVAGSNNDTDEGRPDAAAEERAERIGARLLEALELSDADVDALSDDPQEGVANPPTEVLEAEARAAARRAARQSAGREEEQPNNPQRRSQPLNQRRSTVVKTVTTTKATSAADEALADILREISVPKAILDEAKRRRDLVLDAASDHDAARASWVSGSVAHGTENKPLEDADCGVKINRHYEAFRAFGPDAEAGKGPEEFVQMFADFVLPRVRSRGYPSAQVDLSGNRAIKIEFNDPVEFDDWGAVDPYVDLIIGLTRAAGGLWIPDRRAGWWDPADPELHTELMTRRDPKELRVFRAHLIRLTKRAVKRDEKAGRVKFMCSWNVSALGLELVDERSPFAAALAEFLERAADSIATAPTDDPSPVIDEPIALPDDVTADTAARRLYEMAETVYAAIGAQSKQGAMAHLANLFGAEVEAIRAREQQAVRSATPAVVATALGADRPPKATRSHGAQ